MERLNKISEVIIGCAIEVHRGPGPGLLESIYQRALLIELKNAGLVVEPEKIIDVHYKDEIIGQFRIDILVEKQIVIELKSVDRHDPVFDAQLLSYMKLGGYRLGLLINFNQKLLKEGIKRMIL